MLKPAPQVSSIITWWNQSKETLRMLAENTIEFGLRAKFATVSGGRFSACSKWWISSIVEVPPCEPSTTAKF
ncbi:hypothetical protein BDN70DRAFT_888001 [Pholiota conissans]|uniref:Uncharacterized protein n=1 Tax=Pholiota conissans TaxID=109636 RepID=A0A9P5YPZ3_9AGAR|nr:hypothetical protein BDN70DRAFT_888001 [Pholiota conissans]